ncbi:MAG: hypothetical protein WCG04_00700 [Alphaproteobacteria bacterium]
MANIKQGRLQEQQAAQRRAEQLEEQHRVSAQRLEEQRRVFAQRAEWERTTRIAREIEEKEIEESVALIEEKCARTERRYMVLTLEHLLNKKPALMPQELWIKTLQFLSKAERDYLLPYYGTQTTVSRYIKKIRDSFPIDKVIPCVFSRNDQKTATIQLKDCAEATIKPGSATHYVLDLRAFIPEKEVISFTPGEKLVLFGHVYAGAANPTNYGSWRGSGEKLDIHKDAPGSFIIQLDNGTNVHIQTNVKDVSTYVNEVTLHKNIQGKRPRTSTLSLAPFSHTGQISTINFSENQKSLIKFIPGEVPLNSIATILDTKSCKQREISLSRFYGPALARVPRTNVKQVIMSHKYIIIRANDALWRLDADADSNAPAFYNRKDEGDAPMNVAFSHSCESLFGIYMARDKQNMMLKEIDLKTLVPKRIASDPFIPVSKGNLEVLNYTGGYLKSIGNFLIYFGLDGNVWKWHVPGY